MKNILDVDVGLLYCLIIATASIFIDHPTPKIILLIALFIHTFVEGPRR